MGIGANIGPAQQVGDQAFKWWLGKIVEVGNDPNKRQLGMARVRIPVLHDTMTDDKLPWAQVIMPVTSPGVDGIGDTPYLMKDSFVFGFFADAAASANQSKVLFIVGTIPIYPGATKKDESNHSLSLDARGKRTIDKKGKKLPLEPDDPFKAEYTKNRVIKTESGHMIEYDDTKGHERIHIYHRTGSYVEIQPDGTVVVKSVKDSVEITGGAKNVYIKGDVTANIEGSLDAVVKNNVRFISQGSIDIAAGGRLTLKSLMGITLDAGMDIVAAAPGGFASTVGGIRTATDLKVGNGRNDVIISNGNHYTFRDGILVQTMS